MASALAAVPQAQLPAKYGELVKLALQPRQTRAFVLAAIGWHLCLTSALLRTVSLALVSPATLAVSLAAFALGVLPLLARRKRCLAQLTAPPARWPASKIEQLTQVLTHKGLVELIGQHVVAFVVLALGYTTLLAARTTGWAPQVWVESHDAFYLNERFLFLIGHAAVLGVVYTLVFRCFPSPESTAVAAFEPALLADETRVTIKDRVLRLARARLPTAVVAASLSSGLSVTAYALVRLRVWSAVLVVVGSRGVLRRVLVPSFRVEFARFEVGVRTTLFSIAALCAVETAYLLLDVYLTHPLVPLSKFAKNPNRVLLDGIDDQRVFFSSHALSEIARLTNADSETRTAIYRDVNSDVTAWAHIRDRCIRLLDEHRQFVARRGQLPAQPKPVAQAGQAGQAGQAMQAMQPSTQPAKADSQPAPTIWDQLASGHAATPPRATSSSTADVASTGAGAGVSQPEAAGASVVSTWNAQRVVVSVVGAVWRMVPADAKHVVFGARRQQAVMGVSPASEAASIVARDATRLVAAVVALKELLCHSLAEDAYGSVQKDIRRVLVALVELDSEIRRFGLELEERAVQIDDKLARHDAEASASSAVGGQDKDEAQPPRPARSEYQDELRAAWRSSGAESLELSLTAAIRQILETFARFDLELGTELQVKLADCLA